MDQKTKPVKPKAKKLRFGKMVTPKLFESWRLSGEVAGRILLVEAAAFLSNNNCGTKYPVIPMETRNAITSRVKDPYEVKAFYKYNEVISFLTNDLPGKYFRWQESVKVAFFEINRFLELTTWAEIIDYHRNMRLPKVMTQVEYDYKLDEAKQSIAAEKFSFAQIVLIILEEQMRLHRQRQKTPFNKVFRLAKKTPLPTSGPAMDFFSLPATALYKDDYGSLDGWGDPIGGIIRAAANEKKDSKGPVYTMFEALNGAGLIYDKTGGVEQLFTDFPPIQEALQEYFGTNDHLKPLKDIAPAEYDNPALTGQALEAIGLISIAQRAMRKISPPAGVAILKPETLGTRIEDNLITDEGFINNEWTANPVFEIFRFESILSERKREALKRSVESLKQAYRRLYISHVVLDLTADITKVHEILCTLPPVNINSIHVINNGLKRLRPYIDLALRHSQDTTDLSPAHELFKVILQEINPESLLPNPETVAQMRAYLTLENYKYGVYHVINTLLGA